MSNLWVSRESIDSDPLALRVSISEQWWHINPPDYTGHSAEHLLFGVICQRDVQLNFDGKRNVLCVLKGMSVLWLFLLKFRLCSVCLSETCFFTFKYCTFTYILILVSNKVKCFFDFINIIMNKWRVYLRKQITQTFKNHVFYYVIMFLLC